MIIDEASTAQIESLETVVCIIGAGAAGISAALGLDGTDVPVLLLESGGFEYDRDIQALYAGKVVGQSYDALDNVRLRYFGGTTNHWNGRCGVFTSQALAGAAGTPRTRWPITSRELWQWYPRASELCQLGAQEAFRRPLEDLLIHPDEAALTRATTHLAHRAYMRSPPTRFGEVYRATLQRSANVRVLLGANVLKLRTNESGHAIRDVSVRTLRDRELRIRSQYFILATGGIENARLLLLSDTSDGRGIGNQHGVVGRYFTEHLTFFNAASLITRYPWNMWKPYQPVHEQYGRVEIDVTMPNRVFDQKDIAMCDFRLANGGRLHQAGERSAKALLSALRTWSLPNDPRPLLRNVYRHKRGLAEDVMRRVVPGAELSPAGGPYVMDVHASLEQRPTADSRVYLGDDLDRLGQRRAVLDWQIPQESFLDLQAVLMELARGLLEERLGALQIHVNTYEDFLDQVAWQWHHMSTTRMSDDPRYGVVDGDCRVHGIDNLYVAGSSVFPSGGSINPTLTICALALRLAQHVQMRAQRA